MKVRRQFWYASFLLLLFNLQVMSDVALRIAYEFQKEEIEEKFCVNKDRPELECHGKCHLAKIMNLEHSEDSSSQSEPAPSIIHFFLTGLVSNPVSLFYEEEGDVFKEPFQLKRILSRLHISSVFHPPSSKSIYFI